MKEKVDDTTITKKEYMSSNDEIEHLETNADFHSSSSFSFIYIIYIYDKS